MAQITVFGQKIGSLDKDLQNDHDLKFHYEYFSMSSDLCCRPENPCKSFLCANLN